MEAPHEIWLQSAKRLPINDLDLWYSYDSCPHLVIYIYQLWYQGCNSFWKIQCFTFFPYKSIRDQIWPCHKIGHGQPRVIIWVNLVVLEHPMLHTKFQSHWPYGSGEEDFLRFLPYMGMAAILVMWAGPFEQFSFPHPMETPYEIWLWLAQRFQRR